jgi:6-phosphogluconate dehydrogenase (decarboxylating)
VVRTWRWTIKAAIDEGISFPLLTLFQRFVLSGEADYQNKLILARRFGLGGYCETPAAKEASRGD